MPEDEGEGWELFPHGADVGVRGFGTTRDSAFERAACALTAVITNPAKVVANESVSLSCEAPDEELLLTEWLNALVFEMATRSMLFSHFRVRSSGTHLEGEAWGEPVDVARHEPAAEVKGATLTALRVAKGEDGRWVAQCVVDV